MTEKCAPKARFTLDLSFCIFRFVFFLLLVFYLSTHERNESLFKSNISADLVHAESNAVRVGGSDEGNAMESEGNAME